MKNSMPEQPRIWRSPYSYLDTDLPIGDDLHDETITANALYTDEILSEFSRSGFNAIWVYANLHHVLPDESFPEFGARSSLHLQNMRALIERAGKLGLKIYLSFQPGHGFNINEPFWKNHPEVGGGTIPWHAVIGEQQTYRLFCTSVPLVKEYLQRSARMLLQELPDLGGVILITASEAPSHCYCHYPTAAYKAAGETPPPLGCERCELRTPSEVVSETVTLVRDGVREASPTAQVIASNWGWAFYEKDPAPLIIQGLPSDVILMADFERGETKEILGKPRLIDEYAMSSPGPSPRFTKSYRAAQKRGMTLLPKFQVSTTHELCSVPSLPLMGNLYERARAMRKMGLAGYMGCWSFGNMPSANTSALNTFLTREKLPRRAVALADFASEHFPGCDAALAVQAWENFGKAMNSYPFSIPFLYMGPVNFTLVYPLYPGKLTGRTAGRSWLDDKRRGDDLSASLPGYTVDEIIQGMGILAREWKKGAQLLSRALGKATNEAAVAETNNAWICYHIWRSTWNTYRVYKLRLSWTDKKLPTYLRIIKDELANLEAALPIVARDTRLGYHAEARTHIFDAKGIRKKIALLKKQLREYSNDLNP